MSSEDTSLATQKSFLECSICHENKKGRNPKGLNCLHSFCCDCLVEWKKTKPSETEIECPVCRSITNLPGEGVQGLPKDFRIDEFHDLLRKFQEPKFCQACPPADPGHVATVLCRTCDRRLCDACQKYHISCDLFTEHELVPITHVCSQHGKILSYFCIDCFQGMCIECLLWRTHEKHDVQKLSDCIAQVKKSFLRDIDDLSVTCEKFKSSLAETRKEELKKIDEFKSSLLVKTKSMMEDLNEKVSKAVDRCQADETKSVNEKLTNFETDNLPKAEYNEELHGLLALSNEGAACEMSKKRSALRDVTQKIKDLTKDKHPVPHWSKKHKELEKVEDIPSMLEAFNRLTSPHRGEELCKPDLSFEKMTGNDEIPCHLEILDDGAALMSFEKGKCVKRYDTKGNVTKYYYGDLAESGFQCFTTDGTFVYILCKDGSTLIPTNLETAERSRKVLPKNVKEALTVTYDPACKCLLFSETGKVTCIRLDLKPYDCLLSGGFLRTLRNDELSRCVVRGEQAALLYDGEDQLIHTIPYVEEVFQKLDDVAYFGHDIFLILDKSLKKIARYDMEKKCFLEDLLTKDDGLGSPDLIACHFPYLWVAGKMNSQVSGNAVSGFLKLYKWNI